MSHVDNVILTFSICEASAERRRPDPTHPMIEDHYFVMDPINTWLQEGCGQKFGPNLADYDRYIGGRKALETPLFVGAFNYMPEDRFLAFLRTLPWEFPEDVQYIVKRQHETVFVTLTLDDA